MTLPRAVTSLPQVSIVPLLNNLPMVAINSDLTPLLIKLQKVSTARSSHPHRLPNFLGSICPSLGTKHKAQEEDVFKEPFFCKKYSLFISFFFTSSFHFPLPLNTKKQASWSRDSLCRVKYTFSLSPGPEEALNN